MTSKASVSPFPQFPTTNSARGRSPCRSALRAAVSTAPAARSTPTPVAAGYSDSNASSGQPVPVPRSRKRRGRPRSGRRASTASTRVSVSGRGSSVSGDSMKSRPQNSRVPRMRLNGSCASVRRSIAATRSLSSFVITRSLRASTSAGDKSSAAATSRRARRRASSTPASVSATASWVIVEPIVPGPVKIMPIPAKAGTHSSSARDAATWAPAFAGVVRAGQSFGRGGEPLSRVGGGQCVDDLVEGLASHHLVDLVERQVDAVVGDAALREIIGPHPLRAVTAADLALAVGGARRIARLPFQLVEPRAQHLEGTRLVLVLRFLVLLDHHEPGRQMGDAHRAVGGVDRLPTRPTRPVDVDTQILVVDLDVD